MRKRGSVMFVCVKGERSAGDAKDERTLISVYTAATRRIILRAFVEKEKRAGINKMAKSRLGY